MEMFLMAMALSLLGVAVSAIVFGAATREERREQARKPLRPSLADAPGFFVRTPQQPVSTQVPSVVPLDVLLLQIERHVRLEQAAAETFHHYPTTESLHSPTMSPLVH
jgi:hypothetical protein